MHRLRRECFSFVTWNLGNVSVQKHTVAVLSVHLFVFSLADLFVHCSFGASLNFTYFLLKMWYLFHWSDVIVMDDHLPLCKLIDTTCIDCISNSMLLPLCRYVPTPRCWTVSTQNEKSHACSCWQPASHGYF